ncbi:MAG: archease [Ignavibacteriae bacterium]|nr:archease [Ignavibacteriota bacterium]
MKPGFTILEHPADMGIEATGETLAQAFEQAAMGMMSIILDVSTVEKKDTRTINLRAGDIEQLLVKWLTEILYLYDGQQFVPCSFSIQKLSETNLEAKINGEQLQQEKHRTKLDVKAVTYHQLSIKHSVNDVTLTVFLDI